jgi:hypothetical protein
LEGLPFFGNCAPRGRQEAAQFPFFTIYPNKRKRGGLSPLSRWLTSFPAPIGGAVQRAFCP